MKKLVMLHFWLLLTLCLFGHSDRVFADDPSDGSQCVDEETLRSFYEKFSLIEKEKEALRGKLASCTGGESQEGALDLPFPQKDGQKLRVLESRVAQLEEENKELRERLSGADENSDAVTSEQEQSKAFLNENEESTISPPFQPDPEGINSENGSPSLVTQDTESQSSELSPPVQPESLLSKPLEDRPPQAENSIPESEERKKASGLDALETGSGDMEENLKIQWREAPSALAENPFSRLKSEQVLDPNSMCYKLFQSFERDILPPEASQGDKEAISELVSSMRSFLLSDENLMNREGSVQGKDCSVMQSRTSLQKLLEDIRLDVEGATGVQEKIQLLYQQKIKIETLSRHNL